MLVLVLVLVGLVGLVLLVVLLGLVLALLGMVLALLGLVLVLGLLVLGLELLLVTERAHCPPWELCCSLMLFGRVQCKPRGCRRECHSGKIDPSSFWADPGLPRHRSANKCLYSPCDLPLLHEISDEYKLLPPDQKSYVNDNSGSFGGSADLPPFPLRTVQNVG